MEDETMEMPDNVYVKVDQHNNIIEINSSRFIQDTTDWIKVDEGVGVKYAHAQGNYFEKPLMNDDGSYNYRLENSKFIEV